jgi:acyl-CoA synthetase (AMP-forming)/AMP-acid ligase II
MRRPGFRIGQVMARSARIYGEMPCLVDATGGGRTFAEVESRVNRLASSLGARGVAKDTRVAVLSVGSFGYVELLLACLKLGATFLPLDSGLTMPQLDSLMRRADPDFLFVSDDHVDNGRAVISGLSAPPQLLSLDGALSDDLADLIVQGDPAEIHASVGEDDILLVLFAESETAMPRGVLHSHRMLKGITLQHREYLARPGEVRYSGWPLFRGPGIADVLSNLAVGCASVVTALPEPGQARDCIESGLVTGCFLPVTAIIELLDPETATGHEARLQVMIYQGEPLQPDLLRRALRRWPDCDFWYLHGAALMVQSCLRPEDHRRGLAGEERLLTTVGQPVLGADVRILDDDGREVPPGLTGNVAVQTDAMISGYLDDEELTSRVLREGWFLTGETGQFDERGYLSLLDRTSQALPEPESQPVSVKPIAGRLPDLP